MEALKSYETNVKFSKEWSIVNERMETHITTLQSNSIDLILTDPPYGLDIFDVAIGIGAITGSNFTTTGIKFDDNADATKYLLSILAKESIRITKLTAHAYIFCAPFMFWWLKDTMNEAGWIVRERPIVWIKRESGQNNQPSLWPSSAYEFILFARRPAAKLVQEGKIDWIQVDPILPAAKLHPSEKPVALLKELIQRTTLPGQYVYDPFAGSGSTIEAAYQMKTFAIGCEKAKESYAAMVSRMSKWIKK